MPVAVGVYSTAFNVFNTILLFPFVGVFERVLSQVGREATDAAEDYSVPRFLVPTSGRDLATGVPLVQQEMARYVVGAALFLVMARREKPMPLMADTKIEKLDASLEAAPIEAGADAVDAAPVVTASEAADGELSDADLDKVSGGAGAYVPPTRPAPSRAM